MVNSYVADGSVNIAYRHFVVVGEESALAAEAAECAGEQSAFFEYHDLLFDRQGPENAGYLSLARLGSFASELGLDSDEFSSCLNSRRHKKMVEDSTSEGLSYGVRGTPTVFVNGRRVQNAMQPGQLLGAIALALEGIRDK